MRYLFGFLCACSLALLGCGVPGEGRPCDGVVCPDDGNECTKEYYTPARDGATCCPFSCFFSWEYGSCKDGVCERLL